jgi:flagellar biosynthesis/type III secretory pathway M-ring protein FliF/YscJ
MMGYIVLAIFVAFVLGCFFSFLGGLRMGRKQAEAEYAEEQRRKEQDKKDFDKAEAEIKQEVFGNAKEEKAKLSGNAGRDRFNAINSGLRNNSPR